GGHVRSKVAVPLQVKNTGFCQGVFQVSHAPSRNVTSNQFVTPYSGVLRKDDSPVGPDGQAQVWRAWLGDESVVIPPNGQEGTFFRHLFDRVSRLVDWFDNAGIFLPPRIRVRDAAAPSQRKSKGGHAQ